MSAAATFSRTTNVTLIRFSRSSFDGSLIGQWKLLRSPIIDHDSKRIRTPEVHPRDGGRAAEVRRYLSDLPDGLLTNIAERLVTDKPRETARNFGENVWLQLAWLRRTLASLVIAKRKIPCQSRH